MIVNESSRPSPLGQESAIMGQARWHVGPEKKKQKTGHSHAEKESILVVVNRRSALYMPGLCSFFLMMVILEE